MHIYRALDQGEVTELTKSLSLLHYLAHASVTTAKGEVMAEDLPEMPSQEDISACQIGSDNHVLFSGPEYDLATGDTEMEALEVVFNPRGHVLNALIRARDDDMVFRDVRVKWEYFRKSDRIVMHLVEAYGTRHFAPVVVFQLRFPAEGLGFCISQPEEGGSSDPNAIWTLYALFNDKLGNILSEDTKLYVNAAISVYSVLNNA